MKPIDVKFSSDELKKFKQNGFAGPFDLYEPDEIEKIWRTERRKLLDRSAAVYQEDAIAGVTNISNYDRHLDNQFLLSHIQRKEIVDRVVSVLGQDVLCWRTEFFPKYPGDEGTDWHQANTFANTNQKPKIVWKENKAFGGTITVWTAFTESTKENGCLMFMPGTHEQMFYDEGKGMIWKAQSINQVEKDGMKRGFFGYDYRELQMDPNWKPDESKAVSMECKPGQFFIFWSTLMHASHPHLGLTKKPRLAYVSRYVPTSVQIYPNQQEIEEFGGKISLEDYRAVLVSGEDKFGHNKVRTLDRTI